MPWQVIKCVPITAGEMTELPLNMVFASRTSGMAPSQMLLQALASVLLVVSCSRSRVTSPMCWAQPVRW